MSRTLAIGDIHGCLTALTTLDKELVFGPDDTVITLGDYIDRGPDSRGVIDYLLDLRQRTNLITLRGNHEVILLTAREQDLAYFESWLKVGGEQTMNSYGARRLGQIPQYHWQFLESTVPYHETATHIFVHANLEPCFALRDQSERVLFWEIFKGYESPHCSGKTMVCGHTSQASGRPRNIGHAVCIDTRIYNPGGWLTCLDVGTGHYWQANQSGDLRDDQLSPP